MLVQSFENEDSQMKAKNIQRKNANGKKEFKTIRHPLKTTTATASACTTFVLFLRQEKDSSSGSCVQIAKIGSMKSVQKLKASSMFAKM